MTIFRSGCSLERRLPSASRHGGRLRLLNAALAVALLATVAAPLTAQAQTGDPLAAFDDIAGSTHQSHIERMHQLGILDGTQCAERLFCPGDPILRSTFAVWLVRVADGEDPDPAQTPSGRFQDVEPDHPWITHIERLAELEITFGCNSDGTLFCPDDPVSRAQMASFLTRAFDLDDADPAGFEDVNPDSVHAASIDAIHAAEITVGCTTDPLNYCPGNPTTRAHMATFLSRAITHRTGDPLAAFDDIAGNTHQSHIERMHQLGILDGTQCAERLFCPGDPILRSTFAVWLVRVADGEDPDPAQTPSGRFQDVEPDHPWITHIERLAELEITFGCNSDGTLFCPDDPVSRAQMASFLTRAFDLDDADPAGFEDVNPDSVHAASIDAIHAAEITVGCTTDPLNYCPGNPTTRAHMATFLSRAITHRTGTGTDEGTGTGTGTGTTTTTTTTTTTPPTTTTTTTPVLDEPGGVVDLRAHLDDSDGRIAVGWEQPEHDGGSPVTEYIVQYRRLSQPYNTANRQHEVEVTPPGDEYYSYVIQSPMNCPDDSNPLDIDICVVQVSAKNANGQGPTSEVNVEPGLIPDQPTNVIAYRDGDDALTVEWYRTDRRHTFPPRFIIQFRKGGNPYNDTNQATEDNLTKFSYTHTFTSATDTGPYLVQIIAENDIGPAAPVEVEESSGLHPQDVYATRLPNEDLWITWRPPTEGASDVTSYRVRVRADPFGSIEPYDVSDVNQLSFVATPLLNNVYDVQVIAYTDSDSWKTAWIAEAVFDELTNVERFKSTIDLKTLIKDRTITEDQRDQIALVLSDRMWKNIGDTVVPNYEGSHPWLRKAWNYAKQSLPRDERRICDGPLSPVNCLITNEVLPGFDCSANEDELDPDTGLQRCQNSFLGVDVDYATENWTMVYFLAQVYLYGTELDEQGSAGHGRPLFRPTRHERRRLRPPGNGSRVVAVDRYKRRERWQVV